MSEQPPSDTAGGGPPESPSAANPFSEQPDAYVTLPPEGAAVYSPVIKMICILAIILGVLGTVNAGLRALQVATAGQMQGMFVTGGGPGQEEIFDIQAEMQERMYQVQAKYSTIQIVLSIVQFALSIFLILGAVRTLKDHPAGQKTLTFACVAAVFYELVNGVVAFLAAMENSAVVNQMMRRLTEAVDASDDPGSAAAQGMMVQMMEYSMLAGVVVVTVWTAMKLIYYLFSIWKLSQRARQQS